MKINIYMNVRRENMKNIFEVSLESHYQFERLGYLVTDRHDHRPDNTVFNRTVTLKDTWQEKE